MILTLVIAIYCWSDSAQVYTLRKFVPDVETAKTYVQGKDCYYHEEEK